MFPYIYTPLDQWDIRILWLWPSCYSPELLVSIQTLQLDAVRGQYDVLTYTSGDLESQQNLRFLDGESLQITTNLKDALCALRLESEPRQIWVKAICIDQKSDHEKSEHTFMIREIYLNAKKTVAYIGREGDNSSLVIDFFNDYYQRMEKRMAFTVDFFQKDPELRVGRSELSCEDIIVDGVRTVGNAGVDIFEGFDESTTKKALVSFFCRPWFRCILTIQEFVISKNLEIICGEKVFEHGPFVAAIIHAFKKANVSWRNAIGSSQKVEFYQGLSQMLQALERRNDFIKRSRVIPLFGLLMLFKGSTADIPSDKVYSLTGISEDYMTYKAEYHLPIDDVFLHHAQTMVDKGMGEIVLATAANSDRNTTPGIPSWVPDWNEAPRRWELRKMMSESNVPFRTGGLKASVTVGNPFRHEGEILHVNGAIIHTVGTDDIIHPKYSNGLPSIAHLTTIMQNIQSLKEVSHRMYPDTGKYPTGESIAAVGRALLRFHTPPTRLEIAEVCDNYPWDVLVQHDIDRAAEKGMTACLSELLQLIHREKPLGLRNMTRVVWGRRLCVTVSDATQKLYWGLLPITAEQGDRICLLAGCAVPYVVREVAGKGWALVGDCYVHGIMRGEALKEAGKLGDIVFV